MSSEHIVTRHARAKLGRTASYHRVLQISPDAQIRRKLPTLRTSLPPSMHACMCADICRSEILRSAAMSSSTRRSPCQQHTPHQERAGIGPGCRQTSAGSASPAENKHLVESSYLFSIVQPPHPALLQAHSLQELQDVSLSLSFSFGRVDARVSPLHRRLCAHPTVLRKLGEKTAEADPMRTHSKMSYRNSNVKTIS